MNKIVLNNGIERINSSISIDGEKRVFICIPGEDIVEATLLFANPESTRVMIYFTDAYKITFNGYIKIDSISLYVDPNTRIHQVHIYMSGDEVSHSTEYIIPEEYLPESMRTHTEEVTENE